MFKKNLLSEDGLRKPLQIAAGSGETADERAKNLKGLRLNSKG